MPESDERSQPARAKAVLIDADSGAVLWLNEAASQDAACDPVVGVAVAEALPIVAALGVPDALAEVAATGVPRHLHTNLVSTSKGTLEIVASIHRIMDGRLLLLMENVWHAGRGAPSGGEPRAKRRTR